MKKKILLLGGLRYIIPVIREAHKLGYHVITCDYLPGNIAHKFSDEYYNESTTDKQAVLRLAQRLKIDGIMSFAVDSGVVTAAYVADKMGLPGLPYESVEILQNKGLFRDFLAKNNFTVPHAKTFSSSSSARNEMDGFKFPVIVKPVDSAGSKGVTKVDRINELDSAISKAIGFSLSKEVIVENFIDKKGYSSDSDCFSVNGELKFVSFSKQHFDKNATNPYTPAAYSWPSSYSSETQLELKNELQRLINLLNLGTSIYNIETREGADGKAYIMEVSPRGGGNRLAEMLNHATGVNLIANAVKASVSTDSLDVSQKNYDGYWAEVILHSNKSGSFREINLDPLVKQRSLVELDLWVDKGSKVNTFNAANDTIGTIILRFDTIEELDQCMENQEMWLSVEVE